MMTLYGLGPTRSLRALWALRELGLEFDFVPVNLLAGENRRADFLRLNPAGKLPVLVDGDQVITESAAIVIYLAEKYRDKGLMPDDLGQRAQAYRWALFAVTELEQPLWRIARNTFVYPEHKRIAADIPRAGEDFADMAAVLERHMEGRPFVAGDRISFADCIAAYTLDWGEHAGLLGGFPNLRAYVHRMYARPAAPRRIAEAMADMRPPA